MGGAKFPVEAEAPTEAAPPMKQASAMGTAAYDEDEFREATKGLSERQSLVLAVVDGIVEGNVDVSLSEVLRLLDGMGVPHVPQGPRLVRDRVAFLRKRRALLRCSSE
ncbi:unnamed protein product [Prorocentrum cordatum]|uniref:Uncharacterized protein n=1 Tax=Prorocentrum cordatum TaxID=2364126 RepID=A0ABN9RAL5_9DINO|nr:unnamed protein product [Polarella glacialis]